MIKIEFACSHNHGRSPLAEAFANQYLSVLNLGDYEFISSGTHVHEINEQLAGRKPFTDSEREWIITKYAERFGDKTHPDPVTIMNQFVREEHQYRDVAFKRFGLGLPKQRHDQMIARPDAGLVLVMGKKNLVKAKEIYAGRKVEIETLAGYATGNPGEEFFTAFGGTEKDYTDMAGAIGYYVSQALKRSIESA